MYYTKVLLLLFKSKMYAFREIKKSSFAEKVTNVRDVKEDNTVKHITRLSAG